MVSREQNNLGMDIPVFCFFYGKQGKKHMLFNSFLKAETNRFGTSKGLRLREQDSDRSMVAHLKKPHLKSYQKGSVVS